MEKLIPIAVILSLAVWSGCSSDDEPDTPTGSNGPTVVRVVANTTVSAPTLSSVDEAVWSTVTDYAIDVSSNFSPKLPSPASSAASDSVHVKAIVSGGELFLRIEYDDDDLNLLKNHNSITGNPTNVNFVTNAEAHEDQLFVLFSGLPNNASDVWNWRSLETAPAGLAEGKTLINDTLVRDAGIQVVADTNFPIGSRPIWVHKNGAAFTGEILYFEDRDSTTKHLTDSWVANQIVPGYYVDTLVGNRVHPDSTLAESRWDIYTVSEFDAANNRITVVLKRKLNTGWPEDKVLADSVQFRIGLFDDQDDFYLSGSRRGFTELFWLIL